MKKYVRLPLMLLALFALFISIKGIVVEKATLDEITAESNLIVHGKIIDKVSMWEGKQINTYLTLKVFDVAKGNNVSSTITIKQMGGTVGAYSSEISGQPNYEVDDEVFFFLVDWKGNYWIHSIALGGYSVVETGGVKYAVNHFNSIEIVAPQKKKSGEDLKGEYELSSLYNKIKFLAAKE